MVSRKDLSAKRRKSAFLIAGAAGGNIIFSAAPKPTVEVPAHVALTLADVDVAYRNDKPIEEVAASAA